MKSADADPCQRQSGILGKGVAGSALLVICSIPVASSNSEGAGSVRTVVRLPGAHLYIQVLGNQSTTVDWWSRHIFPGFNGAIWLVQRRGLA